MFDFCNLQCKGQAQFYIFQQLLLMKNSIWHIVESRILRHPFQVGFPLKLKCALEKGGVRPGKHIHLTHYHSAIFYTLLASRVNKEIHT